MSRWDWTEPSCQVIFWVSISLVIVLALLGFIMAEMYQKENQKKRRKSRNKCTFHNTSSLLCVFAIILYYINDLIHAFGVYINDGDLLRTAKPVYIQISHALAQFFYYMSSVIIFIILIGRLYLVFNHSIYALNALTILFYFIIITFASLLMITNTALIGIFNNSTIFVIELISVISLVLLIIDLIINVSLLILFVYKLKQVIYNSDDKNQIKLIKSMTKHTVLCIICAIVNQLYNFNDYFSFEITTSDEWEYVVGIDYIIRGFEGIINTLVIYLYLNKSFYSKICCLCDEFCYAICLRNVKNSLKIKMKNDLDNSDIQESLMSQSNTNNSSKCTELQSSI